MQEEGSEDFALLGLSEVGRNIIIAMFRLRIVEPDPPTSLPYLAFFRDDACLAVEDRD